MESNIFSEEKGEEEQKLFFHSQTREKRQTQPVEKCFSNPIKKLKTNKTQNNAHSKNRNQKQNRHPTIDEKTKNFLSFHPERRG